MASLVCREDREHREEIVSQAAIERRDDRGAVERDAVGCVERVDQHILRGDERRQDLRGRSDIDRHHCRAALGAVPVRWLHDPAHDPAEGVHPVRAGAAEAVRTRRIDGLIEERLENVGGEAEMREALGG